MDNLKQLFMAGVIALCAVGMSQAVAADDKNGQGESGSSEGGASTGSSGSGGASGGSGAGGGSNTITFGNSPGMVSGTTMSNSVSSGGVTSSVVQEVTLTNPY